MLRMFRGRSGLALGIAMVSLLGVLFGASLFTFAYARGDSYLSDDPTTCMNCHIMRDQYDAWQHSSHARVATCNDCHTPHTFLAKWIVKGINGFNHSAAFTLGNFHEPIQITDFNMRIVQANCVECHATLVRMVHDPDPNGEILCITCHGSVGHRVRD